VYAVTVGQRSGRRRKNEDSMEKKRKKIKSKSRNTIPVDIFHQSEASSKPKTKVRKLVSPSNESLAVAYSSLKMATGGGSKRSLDSRVTCSVCLESLKGRQPKLLPCSHTFCLPCLTQLADSERTRLIQVSHA
jgi:hypothetical protein